MLALLASAFANPTSFADLNQPHFNEVGGTASGPVAVTCDGATVFIANQADHHLVQSIPGKPAEIFTLPAAGLSTDLALVVVDSAGNVTCSDDHSLIGGPDGAIRQPYMNFPATGTYHVWVGTYGAPTFDAYHLFGSELMSAGFGPTQTHTVDKNTHDTGNSVAPNSDSSCLPPDGVPPHLFTVSATQAQSAKWVVVDVHADAAEDDLMLIWERPDDTVLCPDDTAFSADYSSRDLNPKHVFVADQAGTYKAWVVGFDNSHANVGYSIAFSTDKTP